MTAVAYVPPNVLPPLLQKFAPLLKRKWFRELVLLPPTLSAPPLLQQDRGLRRLQTVADRAHRAGVDLCAGHRPLAPRGTSSSAACAIAAPASKNRIRSNPDGASAAAT